MSKMKNSIFSHFNFFPIDFKSLLIEVEKQNYIQLIHMEVIKDRS